MTIARYDALDCASLNGTMSVIYALVGLSVSICRTFLIELHLHATALNGSNLLLELGMIAAVAVVRLEC